MKKKERKALLQELRSLSQKEQIAAYNDWMRGHGGKFAELIEGYRTKNADRFDQGELSAWITKPPKKTNTETLNEIKALPYTERAYIFDRFLHYQKANDKTLLKRLKAIEKHIATFDNPKKALVDLLAATDEERAQAANQPIGIPSLDQF